MKCIDLPSGRKLVIQPSPFADAKALYQAVLEEMKPLEISLDNNVGTMVKDVFCTGFSSRKIEAALKACMARATIDSLKITEDSFEAVEHRQDYLDVCFEVAVENITPFTKSLFAKYQTILKRVEGVQA